jgi:hypothetical protein
MIIVVVLVLVLVVSAHPSRAPGPFINPHILPTSDLSSCSTAFELANLKFNLSKLQLSTGGYVANNTIDDMYYCINVCANVNSERNCICNPCGGNQYPAEQVETGDICVASLGVLDTARWSLIDPADPAVGVSLTYTGGQAKHFPRSFVRAGGRSSMIYFYCDPKAPEITVPTFLGGTADEVYRFSFITSSACPLSESVQS